MTTAPSPAADGRARHLLVVDDDDRIRDLLKEYLVRCGFRVTGASDAAAAVSRLAGSAMMFSAGSSPCSASRVPSSWATLVSTKTFARGTTPSSRRTVSSTRVRSEKSLSRCFGVRCRLIGQKRSPLPPAMMQT